MQVMNYLKLLLNHSLQGAQPFEESVYIIKKCVIIYSENSLNLTPILLTEFDVSIRAKQDVTRLDVTMDDMPLVEECKCLQALEKIMIRNSCTAHSLYALCICM